MIEFLKLFEYDEYDEYDPLEELDLHSEAISGDFYHGSGCEEGEDPFEDFDMDWTEWGAVWLTNEKYIAVEFATGYREPPKAFVHTVRLTEPLTVCRIDISDFEQMQMEFGIDDLREMIPHLEGKYDGWVTTGAIGMNQYEDYAIFNADKLRIVDTEEIPTNY